MRSQTFHDIEEYAAALHDVDVRAMLPQRGRAFWSVGDFALGRLGVQHGREGSGIICEGASRGGGCLLGGLLGDPETLTCNGEPFDDRTLVIVPARAEFCVSATRGHDWFSLFVPTEVVATCAAYAEADAPEGTCQVIHLPAEQLTQLRDLVRRFAALAHHNPDLLTALATPALEGDFLGIVRQAFVAAARRPASLPGRPVLPRRQIVCQALGWLEAQPGPALIEDLAGAAGVSERTLRTAFRSCFGVGPLRYLKLRQLHQVRRALQAADPDWTTVTEVAIRFGVWEFGRFARDYRLLFGELPSATLRRGTTAVGG
jgi:AraC family ethanolamine operon transcriptional activator